MWKIASYLAKSFIVTWLTVVFGFLTLIGLLDSMANATDILANGGGFSETFRYMALRAPVIFDRIFMFTLMVAILMVYVKLIRNHELVALLGFGFSVSKQFLIMAPIVLCAAFVSITAIDYIMPPAVRALQAWNIGEYKVKTASDKNPLWMEDSDKIVRISGRPDMHELLGLEIFTRGADGTITEAIWADRAIFENQEWVLHNVQVLPIEGSNGEPRMALRHTEPMIWETNQTPKSIARLAAEPRDISLSEMREFP